MKKHSYKLEPFDGGVSVVDEWGALVYEDVSDLPLRAQHRLVELYNQYRSIDWEAAWNIMLKENLVTEESK